MSEYHRQSDQWDDAMTRLPRMRCGRLDMASYSASTGEPEKFVYFEGEDDATVRCSGKYCDQVAYAANLYQHLVARIRELEAIVAKQHHTADGKPIIEDMTVWFEADAEYWECRSRVQSATVQTWNNNIISAWDTECTDDAGGYMLYPNQCYSTREAAEAAREGEG